MSERHQLKPASFVFLEKEGKMLLLRRISGWGNGKFDVPAGHVEEGETFAQAACREVVEETGVIIQPTDLQLIHVLEYLEEKYLYVFFRATRWSGEPKIQEPNKHSELIWSAPQDCSELVEYTRAAWDRFHAGEAWSVWRSSV